MENIEKINFVKNFADIATKEQLDSLIDCIFEEQTNFCINSIVPIITEEHKKTIYNENLKLEIINCISNEFPNIDPKIFDKIFEKTYLKLKKN